MPINWSLYSESIRTSKYTAWTNDITTPFEKDFPDAIINVQIKEQVVNLGIVRWSDEAKLNADGTYSITLYVDRYWEGSKLTSPLAPEDFYKKLSWAFDEVRKLLKK